MAKAGKVEKTAMKMAPAKMPKSGMPSGMKPMMKGKRALMGPAPARRGKRGG